jgi:hypothetical protein
MLPLAIALRLCRFEARAVQAGELVNATFEPEAVFLWSALLPRREIVAEIDGVPRAGSLARVGGPRALLRFSGPVDLHAWFFANSSCPGPVIAYGAPAVFTEELQASDAPAPLCLVLRNFSRFRFAASGAASLDIFSADAGNQTAAACTARCAFDLDGPVFVIVGRPAAHARLTFSVKRQERDAEGDSCARDFLPPVGGNGAHAGEAALVSANLFSCEEAEALNIEFVVLTVLGVCGVLPAIAALLALGWCHGVHARVRIILSGAENVNRLIQAKVALRKDVPEDLLSVGVEDLPEG